MSFHFFPFSHVLADNTNPVDRRHTQQSEEFYREIFESYQTNRFGVHTGPDVGIIDMRHRINVDGAIVPIVQEMYVDNTDRFLLDCGLRYVPGGSVVHDIANVEFSYEDYTLPHHADWPRRRLVISVSSLGKWQYSTIPKPNECTTTIEAFSNTRGQFTFHPRSIGQELERVVSTFLKGLL